MARITLELPEDIRSKLEIRAAESGRKTVEEHVAALIQADLQRKADRDEDYGAPDDLNVRSAEDLEAKLVQGMNSPAREMTEAGWDEMERRLIERHSRGGQAR